MIKTHFSRRFFLGSALVSISAVPLNLHAAPAGEIVLITQHGQFFDAGELTILNDVTEIMIPRTDTPGAQDAEVAAVVDAMMLTWASKTTGELFRQTIGSFDDAAIKQAGGHWCSLPHGQRTAIVEAIDQAAFADGAGDEQLGYRRLKELVFHVFSTSPQGSRDYVPIPGSYEGNLTLDEYEALMQERSYGG